MKYSSTISSKGQVTVPLEIRNRLGLVTGDRIEFLIEGDRTVIRPSRDNPDPFEKQIGILGPFPGGEEGIKAWISDMRDDDARREDLREHELRSKSRRRR
jgi:AbrB family looped-hinge helix DNA binding protein